MERPSGPPNSRSKDGDAVGTRRRGRRSAHVCLGYVCKRRSKQLCRTGKRVRTGKVGGTKR